MNPSALILEPSVPFSDIKTSIVEKIWQLNNIDLLSTISNLLGKERPKERHLEPYTMEEIYADIMVAVVEAVANGIKHGNKLDPSTYVYIDAKITDGSLVFSVKDEGLGFVFNSVADPTLPDNIDKLSGRGIYFMRTLADKLEFLEGGTLVKLHFNLIK